MSSVGVRFGCAYLRNPLQSSPATGFCAYYPAPSAAISSAASSAASWARSSASRFRSAASSARSSLPCPPLPGAEPCWTGSAPSRLRRGRPDGARVLAWWPARAPRRECSWPAFALGRAWGETVASSRDVPWRFGVAAVATVAPAAPRRKAAAVQATARPARGPFLAFLLGIPVVLMLSWCLVLSAPNTVGAAWLRSRANCSGPRPSAGRSTRPPRARTVACCQIRWA